MKKDILILLAISFLIIIGANDTSARGNKAGPVVYVENQDLFFDAVIAADPLPMKGPFQKLYECEIEAVVGLCTMYGPRDFGYYGGRWWVDTNEDGIMDKDDHFFSCPLLGPGRDMP